MFHLRNPQMDRRIPPRTVNIFSFDERRPGRASSQDSGWPDSAITPYPRHAYREHRGGYLRGVCYFFLPSISSYPANIHLRRLATRSSSSSSCKSSPVPPSRHPLISFRLDQLAHLKMLIPTPPAFSESVSVETKMSACVNVSVLLRPLVNDVIRVQDLPVIRS